MLTQADGAGDTCEHRACGRRRESERVFEDPLTVKTSQDSEGRVRSLDE